MRASSRPQAWPAGILLILPCIAGVFLLAGCRPNSTEADVKSGQPIPTGGQTFGYFQTHFQEESQFIVENVAADLAEMIHFARHHRLPPAPEFSVAAQETLGTALGAPVYQVRVGLGAKSKAVEVDVHVDGPIWSAAVYEPLVTNLAQAVGVEAPAVAKDAADTALLQSLTRATARVIEEENLSLSAALDRSFNDPALHEKAALLLGAFALREHSGDFYDIRWALCRMTAHLAFARFLSGTDAPGLEGQVADAVLETLMNNQAVALKKLTAISSSDPAVISWVRALQARITADYRPLGRAENLTLLERIEWFGALARSVDGDVAWPKLDAKEKTSVPDFCRSVCEGQYSVEIGHELLRVSLGLELAEIGQVHELSRRSKLVPAEVAKELNAFPVRCFSADAAGKAQVQVIGWGTWAGFLQRQLCQAVCANFNFMQYNWGVPDEAREFAQKCGENFGQLRFYPFVRRFTCTTTEEYHRGVDEGLRLTVATPHLSPPECWNYLCYRALGEYYAPNPNPHINEWHKHNPPPGTLYNLVPRLNHPSLQSQDHYWERLDRMLVEAPYDLELRAFRLRRERGNRPSYERGQNAAATPLGLPVQASFTVRSCAPRPAPWPPVRHDSEQPGDEFVEALGGDGDGGAELLGE